MQLQYGRISVLDHATARERCFYWYTDTQLGEARLRLLTGPTTTSTRGPYHGKPLKEQNPCVTEVRIRSQIMRFASLLRLYVSLRHSPYFIDTALILLKPLNVFPQP
eukprot:3276645-Rhodomonas_salina.1